MIDYHIHSSFSGDSQMSMQDACNSAINAGLKEIAFTDHIDLLWPENCYTTINLTDYFNKLNNIKSEYSGKLTVKIGIELGLQPISIDETNSLINGFEFDFIIASVHCVDCIDIINPEFYSNKSTQEAYLRYFNEILSIMNSFNNFSVLGHLDIIRRYLPNIEDRKIKYSEYFEILKEILTTLIKMNRGIEINTSGYNYGLNSFLPEIEIVKLYRELGGEIITVGSDSHHPSKVGNKIPEAIEMIKSVGFKYITSFSNMQPDFMKI